MKKMYGTASFSDDKKRKTLILLLAGIILIGAVFGTALYCVSPAKANSIANSFITDGFLKTGDGQTLGNVFINAFRNTILAVIGLFCMGFCAIAQPFELCIPFIRGVAIGLAISTVYSEYGLKGFFITLLMILPHAVISSVALILASREAISFSNSFAKFAFSNRSKDGIRSEIKLYILKFLVLSFLVLISAIIDCIVTYIFTGFLLK